MYGEGGYGGGFRPRGGSDGGFGSGFGGGAAPVNVGEELDVRIEAVGEKGDGIARKRGFVLFIPNTREGDEVRIRVTKVLRKVGFAEVIGQAQGTPEEGAPAPVRKAPEAPAAPEPAPVHEDSEDFGEEPAPEGDSDDFGDEPESDAPDDEVPEEDEPVDDEDKEE
ncbi:MAG: TRAM domain-containing protein [Candidatus Woesearchaeota archaeon]